MSAIAERLAGLRRRIAAACARVGHGLPTRWPCSPSARRILRRRCRRRLPRGSSRFGENRVQELAPKAAAFAGRGLRWHMIGSLQTNKVAALVDVPDLALVHSVDREKLVERLAELCAARARTLDVLVQVDATGEASKHGCPLAGLPALADAVVRSGVLRLRGTMAMGPLVGDPFTGLLIRRGGARATRRADSACPCRSSASG